MRRQVALLALAVATPALAQQTQITFEGSYDQGQTWQGGTILYSAGRALEIRARVTLVNPGTHTVFGLAGLTFQPTLSNFIPSLGDAVLPFTSSDGSGVSENPQSNLGRIHPFSSSGMNTASQSGLLTSHLDPGNVLRFAGANATTPTTNLAYGVSCGQTPRNIGINFRDGDDVVVFRYAVHLNSVEANLDWLATVDANVVLRQRASWYRTDSGVNSLFAPVTQDTVIPLHIVVPSPSVLALVALVPLARRRRRVWFSTRAATSSPIGA